MISKQVIKQFLIPQNSKVKLASRDPNWESFSIFSKASKGKVKQRAQLALEESLEDLKASQDLLWAADQWSFLVVLQAMDAAGKDGMIKHVMSGVNPQACDVYSFKQPSKEELDHTFLWRAMKVAPERGKIVIFNRSHYEDVLIVKVHPHLLYTSGLPKECITDSIWKQRYEDITSFEKHLYRNGTKILKFFLHISKDEQKKRFIERLDDPKKHWKFSASDIKERKYWKKYEEAYNDAISHTSTEFAPWYIIPSNNKWVSRALVAEIIAHEISSLNLKFPRVSKEKHKQLRLAKLELLREK